MPCEFIGCERLTCGRQHFSIVNVGKANIGCWVPNPHSSISPIPTGIKMSKSIKGTASYPEFNKCGCTAGLVNKKLYFHIECRRLNGGSIGGYGYSLKNSRTVWTAIVDRSSRHGQNSFRVEGVTIDIQLGTAVHGKRTNIFVSIDFRPVATRRIGRNNDRTRRKRHGIGTPVAGGLPSITNHAGPGLTPGIIAPKEQGQHKK